METKRCSRCEEVLPAADFYRAKSRGGLQSRCKACTQAGFAEWRAKQPPKPTPRCQECGQPHSGGRYKFCSQECAAKQRAKYHRRYRANQPHRPCERCGERTHNERWCSRECYLAANVALPAPFRVCADCGVEFRKTGPPTGNGRFCAPCVERRAATPKPKPFRRVSRGKALVRVTKRPKVRTFVAGSCPECGESFTAFAWTGTVFCSAACQKRAERHRRRDARRAAQSVVRIYRRKVFERDNWTCRLCLKPVQQGALVPHPKAATLDHILPLTYGGSHTYENVQTAHFICNSKKSANVTQLSFAA